MTYFHLSRVSGNAKTGPIPVTTTSDNTCPSDCPLAKGGCYAKAGPLTLHWRKVSDGSRGVDLDQFCRELQALPKGALVRHNQAGDLPHVNGQIDTGALYAIVRALKGKRGFTYTHHRLTAENRAAIATANSGGFTVNVSTDNAVAAANAYRQGFAPVVTLLPVDAPNVQVVDGVKVVACPAEKSDKVTCATCALCYDSKREYVIGFRAHGTSKRKADIIARG